MEYRKIEVRAGIFLSISFLIFISFLFVITGKNTLRDSDVYRTRFRFVGGIEKGSLVRYAGLPVGSVSALRIPNDGDPRVEVELRIQKNTPINSECRAILSTIGLLGTFYIEVSAGSSTASRLRSGDLIASEDITAFAQMSGSVGTSIEEATELLRRLNDLLNDSNRAHLSQLVENLNQVSAKSNANLDELLRGSNELVSQAKLATQAINRILQENDSTLHRSLTALDELLSQSKTAVLHLDQLMSNLNHALIRSDKSLSVLLENLTRSTEDLQEFSQSIKEQPWNLVRKSHPPERKLPK